jgi:hypothetical protein
MDSFCFGHILQQIPPREAAELSACGCCGSGFDPGSNHSAGSGNKSGYFPLDMFID